MEQILKHCYEDRPHSYATTLWHAGGHRIKVRTSTFAAYDNKPRHTLAYTYHFYNGSWQEVFPGHAVAAIDDAQVDAAHETLVDKTIAFLNLR